MATPGTPHRFNRKRSEHKLALFLWERLAAVWYRKRHPVSYNLLREPPGRSHKQSAFFVPS